MLFQAAAMLAVASAAVAFVPFRRAIRFGSVPVRARNSSSVEDIIWAIEAAARRLPWRAVCIKKGLAAQRMLRSAGVDATLHYGARHHPQTGKLEAHVWVTVGDRVVIGGGETAGFAEVATFP